MLKVSIIIPAYNQAAFIGQTLESVFAQTFRDFEVIVVNDASADNTRQVLTPFMERIQYIQNEHNLGLPKVMNIGARAAVGEYIVFLDSDDLWLDNMLEVQVQALNSNPDLAFVSGGCYEIDANNQIKKKMFGGPDRQKTFDDLFSDNFVLKLTTLVRRDMFVDVGGFDENLTAVCDYDLWLRLAKRYSFAYTNAILGKYRVHNSNMTKNFDENLADHLRLFQKPEIVGHLSVREQRMKRAWLFYRYAGWYASTNEWGQANKYYFKATLEYPFVGGLFWPPECEKFRFTLPYRLLKPFLNLATIRLTGKLNAF